MTVTSKMQFFKAHLALQDASNDGLLCYFTEGHASVTHRESCVKRLSEAAGYLGLMLTEVVSTTDVDHDGNHIEAVIEVPAVQS